MVMVVDAGRHHLDIHLVAALGDDVEHLAGNAAEVEWAAIKPCRQSSWVNRVVTVVLSSGAFPHAGPCCMATCRVICTSYKHKKDCKPYTSYDGVACSSPDGLHLRLGHHWRDHGHHWRNHSHHGAG